MDAEHNRFGAPFVAPDLMLETFERGLLKEAPLLIGPAMRGVLEDSLVRHCAFRGWHLHAHNIRTNHIHAVVAAMIDADRMLTEIKAYLTRGLRQAGLIFGRKRVWTKGGSKRFLFTDKAVRRACEYVLLAQGPELPRG